MSEIRLESCDFCDGGWVEGSPIPTPDGPHYPTSRCTACRGDGWVDVEYEPLTEQDAIDRDDEIADAEATA